MRKFYERTCPTCGAGFETDFAGKKYCNLYCRPSARSKEGSHLTFPDVSQGNTGAFSELIVCADLLAHGFYVFRSVGPNALYDLIVTKGTSLTKVEVKTTCKLDGGEFHVPKLKSNHHDVLALVVPALKEIKYIPELKMYDFDLRKINYFK